MTTLFTALFCWVVVLFFHPLRSEGDVGGGWGSANGQWLMIKLAFLTAHLAMVAEVLEATR
jgi:hypothetical protein